MDIANDNCGTVIDKEHRNHRSHSGNRPAQYSSHYRSHLIGPFGSYAHPYPSPTYPCTSSYSHSTGHTVGVGPGVGGGGDGISGIGACVNQVAGGGHHHSHHHSSSHSSSINPGGGPATVFFALNSLRDPHKSSSSYNYPHQLHYLHPQEFHHQLSNPGQIPTHSSYGPNRYQQSSTSQQSTNQQQSSHHHNHSHNYSSRVCSGGGGSGSGVRDTTTNYPTISSGSIGLHSAQFSRDYEDRKMRESISSYDKKSGHKRKKRWQIFPGRNRFFCDGKIMMAKEMGIFFFTILVLVSTCTLFFVFE